MIERTAKSNQCFLDLTLTGKQTMINRRSVVAKLARNVLVGDLNELFLVTVRIISRFPETPRPNVKLKKKTN